MKNPHLWKPTKFVFKQGRLIASRDTNNVLAGSRLFTDLVAEFYSHAFKIYCRGHLLDLGCGHVPFYEAYKDYITENTCVDWAGTFHKTPHIDVECDLTEKLPFDNNRFDTILLSDVLEHIPNPENLWKEMSRVLKSDGKLLMSVPFYYWLHEQPHDYYRYTEYALRRCAESAEFEVLLLQPIGGVPEILADILAKNILGIQRIGRGLSAGIQYVTYKLVKTSWGARISKETAKKFPLGYFLIGERM